MPVTSSVISVTASATLLVNASSVALNDLRPVVVRNDSGSTIYLGGSGVTTANGLAVPTATYIAMDLGPGDQLYGVAAAPQNVQVLSQRV